MARRRVPGVRRRPGPAHLLLSRPWVRAPLAALTQPGASAAVLVATAVLGVVAATAPLFLASVDTGALHRAVATCPEAYRPAVTNGSADGARFPLAQPATVAAPAEDAAVRGSFRSRLVPAGDRVMILGQSGDLAPPAVAGPGGPVEITAMADPRALSRVELLDGRADARGLWLPRSLAERLRAGAGDRITVDGRSQPVAGVYRGVDDPAYGGLLPASWCRWSEVVLPRIGDGGPPVRPLVLADDRTLLELAGKGRPWTTWFAAIDPATARARDAATVAGDLRGVGEQLRYSTVTQGAYEEPGDLAGAAARAEQVRSALSAATRPAALAAVLVALLLVAAAGGYWAERRAGEVRLLSSRGIGPAGLAGKAVLEMIGPAVAGALLGWAATLLAAPRLGPAPQLDDGAGGRALGTVAVALVAGLGALGAVAALRGRSAGERSVGLGRSRWALVPWELLLVGAALWAYLRLDERGAVSGGDEVVRVDPLVVAFPLLLLAGLTVFCVRLLGLPAGRLGRLAGRLPVPAFLALGRLAAGRAVVATVLVAVALPVGVLVTCASLTESVSATVRAKTDTYVGAPVVLRTGAAPGATPATDGRGTVVSRIAGGVSDFRELPVLGVDPATFARYAYWRGDFGGGPLPALMDRLGPAEADGRVPAILAGSRLTVSSVSLRSSLLKVHVVATTTAFPGVQAAATPVLVVDRGALTGLDEFVDRTEEVWTTEGDAGPVATAAGAGGVKVTARLSGADILERTTLYPLTWTFGYVQALAVLAGVIGALALLLYLAARQRSRTAAYALSRRMGLSRGRHVLSLLVELAVAVGLGVLLGTVLARLALVPVVGLLRLRPGWPPAATELVVSPGAVLGVLAAAVVLVVGGALATQAVADRVRPADVLREER